MAEFRGVGRDLLLEGVLLGAREIARRRRLIRVRPNPLGREFVEERRDAGLGRQWLLRRHADDHAYRKKQCEFFHEACSTRYAISRTPRSFPWRPTISMPTGSPSGVCPAGTEAAGHRVALIQ